MDEKDNVNSITKHEDNNKSLKKNAEGRDEIVTKLNSTGSSEHDCSNNEIGETANTAPINKQTDHNENGDPDTKNKYNENNNESNNVDSKNENNNADSKNENNNETMKSQHAEKVIPDTEKCNICGQFLNNSDIVYYQGHPQDAVEEYIALTNEKLVLASGKSSRMWICLNHQARVLVPILCYCYHPS